MTWAGGSVKMKKGETFFLPASVPEITVRGEGTAAVSMPK
jgi:mannose-6-phosphate isomerase class I